MSRRRLHRPSRGLLPAVLALGLALGWILGWVSRDRQSAPRSEARSGAVRAVPPAASARAPRPAKAREEPRPAAGAATPRGVAAGMPARVALVIDDLGRRLEDLDEIAAFGVPMAHAVLPYESRSPEVVESARARSVELLLHLPMESAQAGESPGPGALYSTMSDGELAEATRRALAAVPGAVGLNNHMGSALSADRRAMHAVLSVVKERGVFFLDSRTTPSSVAFGVAQELGLPALDRQVFLDDDLSPDAIRAQFARLLALAAERGTAIAIGHPHPATLAVLAEEIPRARAAGVAFVRLRDLLPPAAR